MAEPTETLIWLGICSCGFDNVAIVCFPLGSNLGRLHISLVENGCELSVVFVALLMPGTLLDGCSTFFT